VKADPDLAEKGDRVADRKGAQDAANQRRLTATEIPFGDDRVGNVAAGAAADQDLGSRRAGAIEQNDRSRLVVSAGEDRGREAGGAGADNRDVARRGKL
jgi:hypothetical protein